MGGRRRVGNRTEQTLLRRSLEAEGPKTWVAFTDVNPVNLVPWLEHGKSEEELGLSTDLEGVAFTEALLGEPARHYIHLKTEDKASSQASEVHSRTGT